VAANVTSVMRVTTIRLAALGLSPLFAFGCAGDDTNPAVPDAGPSGSTASQDATVPPSSGDAGAGDGSSNVETDAGPLVTMTVVDSSGSPEALVPVVFSGATGALVGASATDATGAASGLVPAGGSVTVLFGTAATPTLVTIFGVQPGDQLSAVDVSGPEASFIETLSLTATPASPPDDDAGNTLLVNAGTCGATGASLPLAFELYESPPPCVVAGRFPLLVVDQDLTGAPLAFAFQKGNVALADAGPLAVSMATATWSTPAQESVVLSNAPAGFEPPEYVFTEVAGGVPSTASPASLDGGVTFSVHPGYPDFVQTEANVQLGTPPGDGGPGVVFAAVAARSTTPPSAPVVLDMSQLPPFLETVTLDATTPARPALGWVGASSLASSDGIVAVVAWSAGSWSFVVPPGQTSARAPALPTSSSGWAPGPNASFSPSIVSVVEASFWSGYADMRAGSASLVSQSLIDVNGCLGTNGACLAPLPANGTLALTAYATE
jgi:hypothetical protein